MADYHPQIGEVSRNGRQVDEPLAAQSVRHARNAKDINVKEAAGLKTRCNVMGAQDINGVVRFATRGCVDLCYGGVGGQAVGHILSEESHLGEANEAVNLS